MASSAGPTSRSPRRCSAPRRRPCSSCRSWRSPRAGRSRGWSTCASAPLFRIPLAVEVACGAIGVAVFARRRLRGPGRHRVPAGQPGADGRLRRLLGRRPVPLAADRRLVPAVQPVARARPGDGVDRRSALARGADGGVPVSRAARALARRAGDPRLRDLRAVLGDRPRPRAAGDPDAGLRVRAARGPGRLRRRGVVAPRRRVRRLVRAVRDAVGAAPARGRARRCCGRRSPARRGCRPARAPSRCS